MGKQKSILPSFEVLLILVFFIFFVLFMVPKCLKTKSELQRSTDATQATIDSLDRVMDSLIIKPNAEVTTVKDTTKKVTATPTAAATTPVDTRTKLYITIDKLKLRKGPSLDSVVVATLPLFEHVYFLGEVTEFTQEISLGYEIVEEPWVKIRTRKGLDGWVFGAGVHYYKKKRGGVME